MTRARARRSRGGAAIRRSPPVLAALGLLLLVRAGGADAQERPDTVPSDSLGVRPDTIPADSAAVDTVFYNLPDLDRHAASGFETGSWTWDAAEIANSGAVTLVDLLRDVPGVLPLLAGDYGTPSVATAFGLGGGRVRVFRDGFEVVPLEGGVPDFARIGLAGIERIRLVRGGTELRVEMTSLGHDDPRPYSLIEAANGDLNTNFFRGSFVSPRSLGGSLAVGLERTDSRGARGDEPGQRTGSWLRYQLHHGDDLGLAVDFRRVGSETQAEPYATDVKRTDWTVRGRARLSEHLVGEAYYGKSTHDVGDTRDAYALEGGTITQTGVRAVWETAPLRASAAYRRFGGEDLPASRLEVALEGFDARAGGFAAELERATWQGTGTSARRLRAWSRPVGGLSLFASWESGTAGARLGPLSRPAEPDTTAAEPDTTVVDPGPDFRVSDRTLTRVGATFGWRGLALSGARLSLEADSLLPFGLAPDAGTPALAGGERSGWELTGSLPLPFMTGLAANGSLQQWDEGWSYLPERIYRASFDYRRTFLATGNFEFWWSLGVRGRDPMTVRQLVPDAVDDEGEPVQELAPVPFAQSWFGHIQVRIVTVRIFIDWENFTIRRNNQDFPDRLLPQTRTVYGLRWTMWN